MKIIVTGTIGSGKSTLCKNLASLLPDFTMVSMDALVHSLYEDHEFLACLKIHLGVETRSEASALVFNDPLQRVVLEELSLPFMRQKIEDAWTSPNVIMESPLLFEMTNLATLADLVITVGCDDETQMKRVLARDNITAEKLMNIRAGQYSRELRAALADIYVDTSGCAQKYNEALQNIIHAVRMHELEIRAFKFFENTHIWEAIASAYGDSGRHYHTLTHLSELFDLLDVHMHGHPYAQAMEMAVWFHDFVYLLDPHANGGASNEARSAKEMHRFLNQYCPAWLEQANPMHEQVYLALEMIIATERHEMQTPWIASKPKALEASLLFMDADLAILAAPMERLIEYDDQISREWRQEPGRESMSFCQGRLHALKSLAGSTRIFKTPEFSVLDERAKKNMNALMDKWSQRVAFNTRIF